MIFDRPHRMLWSYHYAKRADVGSTFGKMAHRPVVFADSGAYSALTQGAAIDLDEYAAWLQENGAWFEVYANLDCIGDAKSTWRNHLKLEAKGLRPLPVFHYGEPFSWLNRYADAGYRYLALGGLVGASPERLMPWLVQCFKWAAARAQADGCSYVFHGFGITSVPVLASLPWYTVDSSTWGAAYRYGRLDLFDPILGQWRRLRLFEPDGLIGAADLMAHYGFRPEQFIDRKNYHFSDTLALSVRSWRAFEDQCRRRWGEIEGPGAVGLNIYLADGSEPNHVFANQALTGEAHV